MGMDISKLIKDALDEEYDDTLKKIDEVANLTAKAAAKKLKEISPKRRPKYGKSWKVTIKKKRTGNQHIVHNAKYYRQTHLLEKGHQNKDGTRTKAIPHISIAEKEAIENFQKNLKKELER